MTDMTPQDRSMYLSSQHAGDHTSFIRLVRLDQSAHHSQVREKQTRLQEALDWYQDNVAERFVAELGESEVFPSELSFCSGTIAP